MDEKKVIKELQALASGHEKRTQTAQLRDLMEEVEKTLTAGVTRQAVHELLAQNGLKMTFSAFNSALQRIRKERSISSPRSKKRSGAGSSLQSSGNDNKQSEEDTEYPNSDPRALDKIFNATHDLEALAKHAKKLEESEKNAKRKEKK